MANSAVVGLLRVLLTADTANFDAAMKRVGSSAGAWSKDLGNIGRQATALGTSLTKTLTLPILGVAAGAAKLAIDFESAFAGVRKTVDASEPEFAAMAQAFRNLSKEIPISVNELARLGEAAGALGIPKDEIVDFSRVMALLGVTTNVTSEQAAESIAKIQNIFGAAGKDTERFASTLVALGNAGASTEQEILALATRVASAGNTVGLSQGQVLAFSAAIADVGMEAEAGGSAMSRVFVDIAKAVSEGGASLDNFAKVSGVSAEQFAKDFKDDAAGATLAFVQGLDKIKSGGGDLIGTLDALGFTELRQADLLRRLAGDSDKLKEALQRQSLEWEKNTALTEEARKRFETTQSQLTLLWNRIKDIGITLGNALLPAIKSLTDLASRLLPIIDGLAKGFAALPGPVQLTVLGIAGIAAAAGPALMAFGMMSTGASQLIGLFGKTGLATRALQLIFGAFTGTGAIATALSRALSVLTGPIGWLIGAASAIFSLTGTWDEFFRILKAGAQILVNVGVKAFDLFVGILRGFISVSMSVAETIGHYTGLDTVLRVLGKTLGTVGQLFAKFMGWLADGLEGVALASSNAATELPKVESPFKKLTDTSVKLTSATEALAGMQKWEAEQAAKAGKAVGDLTPLIDKNAEAKKRLAEATEEVNSAGVSWQDTIKGIDVALQKKVKTLLDAGVSQASIALVYKLTDTQVRALAKSLAEEKAAQEKATAAADKHRDAMEELDSVGDGWKKTVAAMDRTMVAAIKNYLDAGVSQGALAEAYNLTDAEVRAINKSLQEQKRVLDITKKSQQETADLWEEYYGLIAEKSGSTTDKQLADVQRWRAKEIAQLDASDENWQEHYDAIEAVAKEKTDAIVNHTQRGLEREARDAEEHHRKMVALYGRFSDQAQDALDDLVEANRQAGRQTLSIWEAAWNATTRVVTDAMQAVRELFTVENLKQLFINPMETILGILEKLLTDLINRLLQIGLDKIFKLIGLGGNGITPMTPGITPLGGGGGLAPPGGGLGLPRLGSGGIVHQPTLAMIGERGPEAVTPLPPEWQSHVTPNTAAPSSVTVEMHIHAIDGPSVQRFVMGRDFADALSRAIGLNTEGLGSAVRMAVS